MVHCTDKTIEQKCTGGQDVPCGRCTTQQEHNAMQKGHAKLCFYRYGVPKAVAVLNRDKFERPPLRDRFGMILLVARYMAAKTEFMYSLSRE